MSLALFDILTNKFADGAPISTVDSDKQLNQSIQSHLMRLLNSRAGSLQHLPDYGIPDIAELYQGLPYTATDLMHMIKSTIEKYEPRLIQVKVILKNKALNTDSILHFEIQAKLIKGDHVFFNTFFVSAGMAKIAEVEKN